MKITLALFKQIPSDEIFATGFLPDSPEGLNMSNSGKLLRWIAVKDSHDWAIYCCNDDWSRFEWIKRYGDKVTSEENILSCVDVDADVLNLYRK